MSLKCILQGQDLSKANLDAHIANKNNPHNVTMEQVAFFGNNPIAAVANDTPVNWNKLGSGYAWYDTGECLNNQPSVYGILVNYAYGSDIFQLWKVQANDSVYVRSGNASGWHMAWARLVTNSELINYMFIHGWQAATDFNTLTASGIYQCQGVNLNTPYGSSSDTHFHIMVLWHNDMWIRQVAYDVRTSRIYTRTRLNGTWQDWTQLLRVDGNGNIQVDTALTVPSTFNVNGWSNFEQISIKNYGNPFECSQYIDLHAVGSGDADYTTRIYAAASGLLQMDPRPDPGTMSIRMSALNPNEVTPGASGDIIWQYG